MVDFKLDECIFVDTPKECSFYVQGKCAGMRSHVILNCMQNHMRLIIRNDAKDWIVDTYRREIIDSPGRVKRKSEQEGRNA